jgi:Fe2+ or Zn2+ uptake regulation protein
MGRNRDVKRDIEKGLGGAGRLKILRLLLQNPDHAFTRYEIGKTVPNDPVSIRNDLKTLVQINWVTPFTVHHLNKYTINREHEVVQRLADFLRDIRYL